MVDRSSGFSPERLRKAREERGLTQTGLLYHLYRVGVPTSEGMVRRWEYGRGDPSVRALRGLSLALEVPMEAFFDDVKAAAPSQARDKSGRQQKEASLDGKSDRGNGRRAARPR